MTREIPLTQGKVAIVDDADYADVSQYEWHINAGTGYAARRDWQAKRYVLMHRHILAAPQGINVDHINGDKLDNRRSNLRLATTAQNAHNSRGNTGAQSSYKGVSVYGNRFYVRIFVGGKNVYYGRYTDERTAARIYDYAARLHYGEFAYINLPDELLTDAKFNALVKRNVPSSQYRGVSWSTSKQRWIACIQVDGKFKSIGRYTDEVTAARHYNEAARKYHGHKAILNQLEEPA